MSQDKCNVELKPDKRHVWVLEVKGDCSEVLRDITENLGEYGRRYLEDRLVYAPVNQSGKIDKKNEESIPQAETQ